MTIRAEVLTFHRLGPLPAEDDDMASDEDLRRWERLLHALPSPVTVEEARLLIEYFARDGCFGMAWTLLHRIETCPAPVVAAEPSADANPWLHRLGSRYQNLLASQAQEG